MNNPIQWFRAWVSAFLALRPRGRHRSVAMPLASRGPRVELVCAPHGMVVIR